MADFFCRCGHPFDITHRPRFCSDCGNPLPLTTSELEERAESLNAIHAAILGAVSQLTNVEIARVAGETAWTRIDPTGFSVVAWFRRDQASAGVHGIETYPLRDGGYSITSTADKQANRRMTIKSIDELAAVLPSLLDD